MKNLYTFLNDSGLLGIIILSGSWTMIIYLAIQMIMNPKKSRVDDIDDFND